MVKVKLIGFMAALALVIALGSVISNPVFAAKAEKASVCHFQELVLDPDTQEVVEEEGWTIINISGHAFKAHLGDDRHDGHGDGVFMDQMVVDSESPGENTVSTADCLARDVS
ncbi:MAG: hypothetical protein ACE5Q6_13950 [Dehalococcoidia bacterium]